MKINEITLPTVIHTDFNAHKPDRVVLIKDTWAIINGDFYEAHAPLYFDGMSCPRLTWTPLGLTPFDPKTIVQVLWHDIAYGTHCWERSKADDILTVMNKNRNEFWKRNNIDCYINAYQLFMIRNALRVGGWVAYNKPTKDEIIGFSKKLTINGKPFVPKIA